MSGRGRTRTGKAGKRAGPGLKKKKSVSRRKKQARRGHARPSTSEGLLEKLEACLDSFQYEEAAELCMRTVEREPDSVQVLEEVGPVLLELGHTDRALKCLLRAAELSPDEGHVKFLYLGQLHCGQRAAQYLTTAIDIMRRGREGCEGGEGEVGEGVNGEEISRAYCSLAEVYLTDSCFSSDAEQRCYESCELAARFAPDNPEAHQLRASCLLSMQRNEEAKEAIRKSLLLWQPSSEDHKMDSGSDGDGAKPSDVTSEGVGGEGVGGEGVRGEGVEMPPYFSRVNCAKILMELQLHNEAYSVLERLLRDDDEVVLVWYLMGWLHVLMDDPDSAHFYLEQANKLVGKMECDDEQMTGHIAELLVDLDQRQQSKERGLDREGEGEGGDCEGGECEGGGEQVDRTSIMDTT